MDDYKKVNNPTKPLATSQDSHQNLAEYERDKSSNFKSFRWGSDDVWEMWDCSISSTFRAHLWHGCFSYQREIKIVSAPFLTISSTQAELNSSYCNFYFWQCIFLSLPCLLITTGEQKKYFLFSQLLYPKVKSSKRFWCQKYWNWVETTGHDFIILYQN